MVRKYCSLRNIFGTTVVICMLLGLTGCVQTNKGFTFGPTNKSAANSEPNSIESKELGSKGSSKTKDQPNIMLSVKNSTGKTLYVVCFAYVQKRALTSVWRMTKSTILTLENNGLGQITVDCPAAPEVRKNVYGYLGVFDDIVEAQNSTFELIDDRKKLDLDLLYKIGKNVIDLKIEKISADKSFVEYEFKEKSKKYTKKELTELDFSIENQAGKPLIIVAFMYKQDNDAIKETVWNYKKTEPFRLNPGEVATVDLEGIKNKSDALYARGTIGIFDLDQEQQAKEVTYQLLDSSRVVELDKLFNVAGKTVVLKVQKYGIKGDLIDYVVKEPRSPKI